MRRPIILNRRFYWVYPDGNREPVQVTERLLAQVRQASYQTQVQAAQRAAQATEAPPRRTNNPPRPPSTAPMLPQNDRDIGNRTLSELAHDYGWGSVARCTAALKQHRPSVYEQARANGRARGRVNLRQGQPA
jgi:hypothetical protein